MKLLIIQFLQKKIPTEVLDQCKNNPNEPQLLPSEVKKALKKMSMGKWFYEQVVMVFQNESKNKK